MFNSPLKNRFLDTNTKPAIIPTKQWRHSLPGKSTLSALISWQQSMTKALSLKYLRGNTKSSPAPVKFNV